MEAQGITGYLPDARTGEEEEPRSAEAQEAAVQRGPALQAVREGQPLSAAQWAVLPREGAGRMERTAFIDQADSNTDRCPAGQTLPLLETNRVVRGWGVAVRKRYGFTRQGRAGGMVKGMTVPCATGPHAAGCGRDPAKGRRIERDQYEEYRERMRARMASPEGRAAYRRRRETVEPRIGWIQHGLGVRRFLRRGLEQVRTEGSLICTAANLAILLRHGVKVAAVL